MKIGIFSGTFDPVHLGHVSFIETVIQQVKLDKVVVIVERTPAGKKPLASLEHRVTMAQLAFSSAVIEVRASHGPITTLDDLNEWRGNDVHVIVGSDTVNRMVRWNNLAEWAPQLNAIVGLRAGDNEDDVIHTLESFELKTYHILASPMLTASSSSARIDFMHAPTPVAEYIAEHNLYSQPLL